jgi:hypothetical protein
MTSDSSSIIWWWGGTEEGACAGVVIGGAKEGGHGDLAPAPAGVGLATALAEPIFGCYGGGGVEGHPAPYLAATAVGLGDGGGVVGLVGGGGSGEGRRGAAAADPAWLAANTEAARFVDDSVASRMGDPH